MFFIYQIFIILILFFSPFIILVRLIKKKEHKKRFLEKFCLPSKKRSEGKLIWIHAASVGEFLSVVPIIDKLEKNKKIKTILITTSTLSSSRIFYNYKFKKTIHQFFPIDFFYFSQKFLNYWKPSMAIFIDSEIWPSMFKTLKKNTTPLLLVNARITKKSFKRWNLFNKFSNNIFHNLEAAFPQNNETKKYLKKLDVKKIIECGNLKFCQTPNLKNINLDKSFLASIKKRLIFCASSTHPGEELNIMKNHLFLKKKYKNLLTIIIPRHVERVGSIFQNMKELNLKGIVHTSNKKIDYKTDIYLVDTYGETQKFFNVSKITFIGGSMINHGGQNPIEPARFGLNILHGPYVRNFKDVYKFFHKQRIAYEFTGLKQLIRISDKLLLNKKKNKIDLKKIGKSILKKNLYEINKILNNEIKKT